MSLLDGILKNIGGAPDDVANLAEKIGIDPAMAEKAIAVLGQTHQMQGDTVELASAKTGLDTGVLSQIVEQIGGEGSLNWLFLRAHSARAPVAAEQERARRSRTGHPSPPSGRINAKCGLESSRPRRLGHSTMASESAFISSNMRSRSPVSNTLNSRTWR